ncbi:MAG: hypothetical protein DI585_05565 [Pseudomonas fluorescens]|nr:MAG: hypothetical protein DI585_05565 [Pseudomonas fluorescens]
MNVNEIRDRIVELSHQSAGDGEVQAKALGWLNAAYHEIMDEVVVYLPPSLQVRETVVTAADGTAVMAQVPYRVMKVVDSVRGKVLEAVSPLDIMEMDPQGQATGFPQRYTVTAEGVQVHPAAEGVELGVLYVPLVVDLEEGGPEGSIFLPHAYHSALVWGGLVWSSLFERGFGSGAEIQLYMRQWLDAKQRVKMGLLHNLANRLRVQPFDAA